ncbi:MAG: 50S ribosomal protein L25 [Candidatus Poribacteria bacterium]|nr:50S ribosomal protein L25 [Candidatus Poribacteria bacterium]
MQQAKLEAQKREVFGKGAARALRRAGQIPAVLYGRQQEVTPLQLDGQRFQRFLRSHGENALIDLEVADQGTENVMIKEVQRDAVDHHLLHTDFMRVSLLEPVTSAISFTLVGSAPGAQEGGVLEFPHRELAVHCLPTLLPEEIEIDISNLQVNDFIYVGDVSVAEGIEILDDPHTAIVLVSPPRVEAELEEIEEGIEEEAEVVGEAEPEVISRRREDEE